jgi:hypothetical protein
MRLIEQKGRFGNFLVWRLLHFEVLRSEPKNAQFNGLVAEAVIQSLAVELYFRAFGVLEEGISLHFWFSLIAIDLHRDVSVSNQGVDEKLCVMNKVLKSGL